jgi:hypothetical protein
MMFLSFLGTAVMLAAAAYAQYRIPRHTTGGRKALVARAVLAVVGLAFGYVMSAYAQTQAGAWLAFLSGFGAVHVPAAVILYLKSIRGR